MGGSLVDDDLKFRYGQRVRITCEGFYKGSMGIVMKWVGAIGGEEWYKVMILLPDTLNPAFHKPIEKEFTASEMEVAD